MKQVFYLRHAEARHRAGQAVKDAPDGYRVCVEPEPRSLEASAKFHAICDELAGHPWAGKPRDASEWKVLLVSGHTAATKHAVEMVPGLENEFVNIRESTAHMNKQRMGSLLEYAQAYTASLGVREE